MYMSKSSFLDLTKPSLIGVISFREANTGLQKDVQVHKQFWQANAYLPTKEEVYNFLLDHGHMTAVNAKFTWVM